MKKEYESVKELAEDLLIPCQNQAEKARAVWSWITNNIAYDLDQLKPGKRGNQSADAVVKSKSCVCQGYANLFSALCKEMDLETVEVDGATNKNNIDSDHAWNAIKLNDKWHLTWGAGSSCNGIWSFKHNPY